MISLPFRFPAASRPRPSPRRTVPHQGSPREAHQVSSGPFSSLQPEWWDLADHQGHLGESPGRGYNDWPHRFWPHCLDARNEETRCARRTGADVSGAGFVGRWNRVCEGLISPNKPQGKHKYTVWSEQRKNLLEWDLNLQPPGLTCWCFTKWAIYGDLHILSISLLGGGMLIRSHWTKAWCRARDHLLLVIPRLPLPGCIVTRKAFFFSTKVCYAG